MNNDSGSEDLETVYKGNHLGGIIDRFLSIISTTAWIHCIYSIILLFFYTRQKGIF